MNRPGGLSPVSSSTSASRLLRLRCLSAFPTVTLSRSREKGLTIKSNASVAHRFDGQVDRSLRGDDYNVGRGLHLTEPDEDFKAVHVREMNVDDCDRDRVAFDVPDRVGAVVHHMDGMAVARQIRLVALGANAGTSSTIRIFGDLVVIALSRICG